MLVVAHVQLAPTSEAGLSPGAARQEQDQQQESTALPAALASPFPALHAGSDGAAVLASENKYWQVLSREEHQQLWRLPPAAPAFTSWLLQEQALPQLAAAVLAAWTYSSSGACTGAGGGRYPGQLCRASAASERQRPKGVDRHNAAGRTAGACS